MNGNRIYPFASGSDYTASFATTSSYAISASYWDTVYTASNAIDGISGSIGLRGNPDICFISASQYFEMLLNPNLQEVCVFPDRDLEALGGSY